MYLSILEKLDDWEGDLIANPTKQSGIKEET